MKLETPIEVGDRLIVEVSVWPGNQVSAPINVQTARKRLKNGEWAQRATYVSPSIDIPARFHAAIYEQALREQRAAQERDVKRHAASISTLERVLGQARTLEEQCPNCHGRGDVPNGSDGLAADGSHKPVSSECHVCSGLGRLL